MSTCFRLEMALTKKKYLVFIVVSLFTYANQITVIKKKNYINPTEINTNIKLRK